MNSHNQVCGRRKSPSHSGVEYYPSEEYNKSHVDNVYDVYEEKGPFWGHGVLRRPKGFHRLTVAGQARGPWVHYDACLDPGRAPWRCSEHSKSLTWLFSSGVFAPPR